MKGGVWGSDFFLNDLNWLRGCVNLCLEEIRPVEVLLLHNWRKKLCSFSPHVRCPGEAFLDLSRSIRHLKHISPHNIDIKCWNRKILALGMPLILLNAASNITHSRIASQDSSPVTMTFSAHCTVHCAVGVFYVNVANHCAHDITCRSATSWNGAGSRSALHYNVEREYHELWLQGVVLHEKTMASHKPGCHLPIWSILSVPGVSLILCDCYQ